MAEIRQAGACLLTGLVMPWWLNAAPLMDAVVVTASRAETGLPETPAPITRLPESVIADSYPQLISDVLDRVPGVHMTDLGNEQHSMSIRQPITTSPVYQYLEDGIPIRPIGVFNHNALNEINLSGVSDIEVVRGASSSLHGSNAVGGAVNFLTRAPSLRPEAHAGWRGNDLGYQRVDAGASATYGETGLRVAFYRSRTREGWREYSDADKTALTVRWDQTLTTDAWLKTVLSHTDLVTDMTGSLGESDYQRRPSRSYNTFTSRTDRATRLSSTLETDWGRQRLSRVTVYLRDNAHDQNPSYLLGSCAPVTPAATCTTNGRVNANQYVSGGVDLQWQQALSHWPARVIAGLAYDHTTNEFNEQLTSVQRDASLRYRRFTVVSRRRDYQVGIRNPAFYGQLEWQAPARTTVVAGLRHDRLQYDFDNKLMPSPATGGVDERRDFSRWSPRLGIVKAITESQEMYVNLSHGFVPPEVSQLYGTQDTPDLTEARFVSLDAGFRRRWAGRGQIEAGIYRLEGKDEIINFVIQSTPFRINQNRNAGATRHEGIEIGGDWRFWPTLSGYVSGTLSRHVYRAYQPGPSSADRFDGNRIPGASRSLALAGVDWQITPGMTLSPEVQRIGSYWMNDANTVRYPGHTLVNLRMRWRQGAWTVFSQLTNLTDARHAEMAGSSYRSGPYLPDLQNTYTPGNPRALTLGVSHAF